MVRLKAWIRADHLCFIVFSFLLSMLLMEPGYSVSALSVSSVRKIGRGACVDEGSLAFFNGPFVWWLSLCVWAWSVGGRVPRGLDAISGSPVHRHLIKVTPPLLVCC